MENWKGIANRLREHEEPYKIGSWEKFEADFLDSADSGSPAPLLQDPKVKVVRRISWGIWSSGVAAAALLIFGLIWLWPDSVSQNIPQDLPQMVQSPGALPNQGESSLQGTPELEKNTILGLENELFESGIAKAMIQASTSDESDFSDSFEILPPLNQLGHELSLAGMQAIVIEPSLSLQHSNSNIKAPSVENARTSSAMAKEKNGLLSSVFGNLNEDLSVSSTIGGDKTINRDKWALGLAVASMMTSSEEVNVGGGVSVAYKLSDRMFLRSGISLARLGVSTPAPGRQGPSNYVGYAPASNGSATGPSGPQGPSGSFKESIASVSPEAVPGYYTRLLRGASSNLLTLDVPLDLKYFVTDKYFTSVGVSFLGILNESRTNHYIENINQPLFNGYSANGQDLQFAMKTLHVNEATAYQPLQGNSYAGYLNFSVGRQTRVSNKISLSIEPFFKLPVGKLMREEMNMTNGGIRIVTGF